jgi:hypothetical protein
MRIPTPRSLALGDLACLALLAAGCAEQAPPLEPDASGALLAGWAGGRRTRRSWSSTSMWRS